MGARWMEVRTWGPVRRWTKEEIEGIGLARLDLCAGEPPRTPEEAESPDAPVILSLSVPQRLCRALSLLRPAGSRPLDREVTLRGVAKRGGRVGWVRFVGPVAQGSRELEWRPGMGLERVWLAREAAPYFDLGGYVVGEGELVRLVFPAGTFVKIE